MNLTAVTFIKTFRLNLSNIVKMYAYAYVCVYAYDLVFPYLLSLYEPLPLPPTRRLLYRSTPPITTAFEEHWSASSIIQCGGRTANCEESDVTKCHNADG